MIAAINDAMAVSQRGATNSPIFARLAVNTTSGTTGRPQVVLFSPKAREVQALLVAPDIDVEPIDEPYATRRQRSIGGFEQVERDVGLELVVGLADAGEVILHTKDVHVVFELIAHGGEDVVLGTPRRRQRVLIADVCRRYQVIVHEHEYA